MSNLENAKIYRRVGNSGADQYAVVNLDATNFCVTLNATHTLAEEFGYVWDDIRTLNSGALWKVATTSDYPRAYYVSADGQTQGVWGFTSSIVGGTLVLRDNDGRIKTATPSVNNDAATKLYVDNAIASAPGIATVTNSGSGPFVHSIAYTSDTHALSYSLLGGSANPLITPIYVGHADLTFINTVGRGGFRSTSPTATTAGYPHNGQFNWSNFGGVTNAWGFQISALDIPNDRYNQLRVWQNGLVYNKYLNSTGSTVDIFTIDPNGNTTVTGSLAVAGAITSGGTTVSLVGHTHSISAISDVSTIGTTAVSTKTISTSSASIASGNSDLVTGGAIYSYVENEGGKVKSLTVGSTNYTPTNGVITIPAYPSVSNSTITVKQTGLSDQTFTLNGSAVTITLTDTNTWRPLGTGASDAAAGNHTHTASEVGALPDSTAYLKSISKSGSTYTITNSANGTTTWTIPTVPSDVSAFNNDAGYLTTVAWGDVTGKPSTFTPTAHTHSVADVTDVSTIGTTAVSTVAISTSSADIASGNSKLVTGGAIADALANVSYKPTISGDTLIFY